jgi:single-strand DNA-binding protein
MNIAIIQGRPTRDPEISRSERTGKLYCRITIACDRPYKGKDVPKRADYFRVVCFDKLAQTVHNNLAKGALCTVLGRLEQDEYLDKVGNKRETVTIVAQNVTIHEWLRKHRPLEELDSDFDIEPLIPREITNSLFKQIDIDDEDIPDDLAGKGFDDLL